MTGRCYSCKRWFPHLDLKGRCAVSDRNTSDLHLCRLDKWEPRTKADAFDAAFDAGVQVGYAKHAVVLARASGDPQRIDRAERLLAQLKEEASLLDRLAEDMAD